MHPAYPAATHAEAHVPAKHYRPAHYGLSCIDYDVYKERAMITFSSECLTPAEGQALMYVLDPDEALLAPVSARLKTRYATLHDRFGQVKPALKPGHTWLWIGAAP